MVFMFSVFLNNLTFKNAKEFMWWVSQRNQTGSDLWYWKNINKVSDILSVQNKRKKRISQDKKVVQQFLYIYYNVSFYVSSKYSTRIVGFLQSVNGRKDYFNISEISANIIKYHLNTSLSKYKILNTKASNIYHYLSRVSS